MRNPSSSQQTYDIIMYLLSSVEYSTNITSLIYKIISMKIIQDMIKIRASSEFMELPKLCPKILSLNFGTIRILKTDLEFLFLTE